MSPYTFAIIEEILAEAIMAIKEIAGIKFFSM